MRARRRYEAHFLHRSKWWVAWTDDVPGALTQGSTLEEARENLKDAIALMLLPYGRSAGRHGRGLRASIIRRYLRSSS
jgi:hypothetical protein